MKLPRAALLFLFLVITKQTDAKEAEEKTINPPSIGNFALPISQQPVPLISFGQNIVSHGQLLLSLVGNAFIGNDGYLTNVLPRLIYGITDNLVLVLSTPFAPKNKDHQHHSSGLEDAFAQLEYAFYSASNSHSSQQATIVASMTFPTGSSTKNPPTGVGAPSYFAGATYNYTTVKWYFFVSPGVSLSTSRHGTKFGDEFLYQFGVGRNIPTSPKWIVLWLCEFDGEYNKKDRIKGKINPNSGGNIIYITPSIWISSKRTSFQLGVGFPVVQNLYGDQSKQLFVVSSNLTFTF